MHTQHPLRGTGGGAVNDDNPGRADSGSRQLGQKNPCTLVSQSQARAIIGKPVGPPSEAPQGPTCIYTPRGAKSVITLAVESMSSSRVKPQAQLHNRRSVNIGRHIAYCGMLGGSMLIVPLRGSSFLVVTAACPVATGFAAIALGHMKG